LHSGGVCKCDVLPKGATGAVELHGGDARLAPFLTLSSSLTQGEVRPETHPLPKADLQESQR